MFLCKECGGFLNVIKVYAPPETLSKSEKLIHNRICDVECVDCKTIVFAQPYDFGSPLNPVPKND